MPASPAFPKRIDPAVIAAAGKDALPTFLGVGMPKCGTTWAHAVLRAHPEIGTPPRKELNFWADVDNGLDSSAYLALFRACREPIRGEFSTMYCDRRAYLERIRHCLPGVKIIVGFRDPADALYSAYLHSLRAGRPADPFSIWLDNYVETYGPVYDYNRVARDLAMFDNVFLYFYEDAIARPADFAAGLYRFLGADSGFRPDALGLRFNNRYVYRSRKVYLATVEGLIRLYGNHRGRTMVSAPHIRPWWVDLLLRANERRRRPMSRDDRAFALSRIGKLCDEFAARHGKFEEWGLT